jgi:hypothetical protein
MGARRWTTVVAFACAPLLGCSSSHMARVHTSPTPATSAPPALSRTDAAAKYLQIATPVDSALATMDRELIVLQATATSAEVAKLTEPGAIAIDTAVDQLAHVSWPVNVLVSGDMKIYLVTANAVAAQLRAAKTQDAMSLPAWATQLKQDSLKAKAASAIVRADLSLPPPS